MLVVFPLALWTTGVVFDVVGMVTGSSNARIVAFYNIGAGIIGALAAAVPGFVDYFTLKGRAARVGTWHMTLNLAALALFTVSWLARTRWSAAYLDADPWIATVTGIVGLGLVLASGWLGGSLVYKHGMGVAPAMGRQEPRGRRAA